MYIGSSPSIKFIADSFYTVENFSNWNQLAFAQVTGFSWYYKMSKNEFGVFSISPNFENLKEIHPFKTLNVPLNISVRFWPWKFLLPKYRKIFEECVWNFNESQNVRNLDSSWIKRRVFFIESELFQSDFCGQAFCGMRIKWHYS